MSRKLPGSAIVPGTITVTQITGGLNDTTNASYAQANTARTTANDAYGQANTARADANTTFGTINTTFGTVNSSFGTVNTNYQAAYAQANTARTTANDAYGAANTKLSTSGGSISGDLAITGNLTVQGNATTINVSNLSVNDSIILLSTNAVGDSNDIGFIGHFDRGATETHAGLIRKATENRFYLFDNYEVEPSNNVIDVAGNNFRVGNLRLGIINANSFVTAAGLDVTGQANAAYGQANAAYGAANNRVLKAGDTMTGQLNISSGGLLVTGNVGIGTASPAYVLSTSSSAHGQYSQHRQSSGTGVGQEMYYMFNDSSGAAVNYASIYAELAANTAGSHTGKIALRTVTAGTLSTKLLVDQTGNVGIGTASPSQKLDAVGIIKSSGASNSLMFENRNDSTKTWEWYSLGTGSSGFAGLYKNHNTPATAFVVTDTGSVGVGITNPSGLWSGDQRVLHLFSSGGTAAGMRISSVNATAEFFSSAGSVEWGLYSNTASPFTIYTNGSHRFRITSDGNVGIGTTSPSTRLHLYNTSANCELRITADSSNDPIIRLTGENNGTGEGLLIYYDNDIGDTYFKNIYPATNAFHFDTASVNNALLIKTNGDVTVAGALTESSSINIKENVYPITDALAAILKLVGVTYDRKDGSAKRRAGLIAEEVEQVLPNVVQKDENGKPLGIHYTNLIAYLVESIKELKQEIDMLKSK